MPMKSDSHDVIVVGAGVAGSLIASKLAASGLRVLLLEAGPDRTDRIALTGAYAREAAKIPSAPYSEPIADAHAPSPKVTDGAENGHYQQVGDKPFKSTYQRLVGGSTWHWLGNTPRFLPNDFRLKERYGVGVDWPIDYDELESYYADAERELGVSGDAAEWEGLYGSTRSGPFPMPPIWRAYGDSVIAERLDGQTFEGAQVRIRVTPQARNSVPYQGRPPCAGNSSCVPICPIAAKYDATVHTRRATGPQPDGGVPAELRARAVVTEVLKDENGLILGVVYDRWSEDGKTRTRGEQASARIVVVAAHAIESAVLLLASGLSPAGPVGKNLMDHLQGYGGAVLRQPVFPFRGPPVTSGIDEFRDGCFRSERAAFRVSIGNDGWGRLEPVEETVRAQIFVKGLLGEDLRRAVRDRITRMVRLSYSTEMLPDESNRVELGELDQHGVHRPKLRFGLPEYNVRAFQFARNLFQQFFTKLDASETKFSFPASSYSGAGHIMGTARMGATASSSVVDKFCRAHEHPNLYVVGASAFPTCGTANPTLTVAALALRAAKHIELAARQEA